MRFWIIYILVQVSFFGDCFRASEPVFLLIFHRRSTMLANILSQSPHHKKASYGPVYVNLIKLLKYGNIETTTKFSRLKSIYSKALKQFICFQESLYSYKGNLSPFIVKKMFIEIEFKHV